MSCGTVWGWSIFIFLHIPDDPPYKIMIHPVQLCPPLILKYPSLPHDSLHELRAIKSSPSA